MLATALLLLLAPAPAPDASLQRGILHFLNQVIVWHRESGAIAPDDTSELVFGDASRQLGRQGLSLAFDSARAEVALERPEDAASGKVADAQVAEAQAQVKSLQAEVDDLSRRIAATSPARRDPLRKLLEETRSELQLAQVRQETVLALANFAGVTGTTGLAAQIEELQRSVPESNPNAAPAPRATASPERRPSPTGLVALTSETISIRRKIDQLKAANLATARLSAELEKRRAPLIGDLRKTLQRGDQLAAEADTSDPATLPRRARDIDNLTAHFRKVSAALVPLGKLAIVLDTSRTNLEQWTASVDSQYGVLLRKLLLHLGLLIAAVVAIFGASAFWRRAIFRYVRDARRRQQSLLIRRVVVAITLALMITFSVVTELGSIATFAGFITAGLAVALQNVILSMAAYFFLIGRYGIRVGDRVQIGGVTADVMDIGLVRLHLMELGSDGSPTGRVTVFSNSVLFQPAANFFKQIPGSRFEWHRVTLTLSPETDYRRAEQRLLEAVGSVFAGYREHIAQQHAEMSENVSITIREPSPHSTLRLTDGGLEMTIRYPVPLDTAAKIDDEMTRALLDAVEREPRLRLIGSATATIQLMPEPEGRASAPAH